MTEPTSAASRSRATGWRLAALFGLLFGTVVLVILATEGTKRGAPAGVASSPPSRARSLETAKWRPERASNAGVIDGDSPAITRAFTIVEGVAGEMTRALSDARKFPDLAECRRTPERDCSRLLSNALRAASNTWGAERLFADFAAAGAQLTRAAILSAVESVLTTSATPAQRIAALKLLDMTKAPDDTSDSRSLGAQAYAGIGSKLEVEQMLLLREYSEAPCEESIVAHDVAALAENPQSSAGIAGRALLGLARVGNNTEVSRVLSARVFPSVEQDAVRALAICASACTSAMSVMAKRDAISRRILLRALAWLAPEERRWSLERVARNLPAEMEMSFEERDQLRYLRRLQ